MRGEARPAHCIIPAMSSTAPNQREILSNWLDAAPLPVRRGAEGLLERGVALRKRLGGMVSINVYKNLARVTGALPQARPERHGLTRIPDIAYAETGLAEHQLDVYRPRDEVAKKGPLPVL